jgi:hypothetical protein
MKLRTLCVTALATLASSAALAASPYLVNFDNGMEGWQADGGASVGYSAIDKTLGDGSLSFHGAGSSYGWSLINTSNAAFLGDYTAMKSLTFSLDVTVKELSEIPGGIPLPRELVIELRDYDKPASNRPFSSVWYSLGMIRGDVTDTQHLSVTINDTSSLTLPAGWHGTGAVSGWDMVLPPGQTFQRLLQDVDAIAITTFVPGYFYAGTYFDMAVDNISISAVPEPSQWGMMAAGLGLLGLTARRRKEQRLG